MLRIIQSIIFMMGYCPIILMAQVDYNFVLKDSLELPGIRALSLIIKDVNGDGFPDYSYRDDDAFYVVNGADLSIITTIPRESGIYYIRPGDLNNDNMIDLALFGNVNVKFYLAPDYNEDYTITLPDLYEYWGEFINEVFFDRVNGIDLIFIGVKLERVSHDGGYYFHDITGTIMIYQFTGDQISLLTYHDYTGCAREIGVLSHGDTHNIIVRTSGSALARNDFYGPIYDYAWADLFSITDPYELLNIWSVGERQDFSEGAIGKICIGKPDDSDDDLLFFNSCFNTEEDVLLNCIDNANGNLLWQRQTGYQGISEFNDSGNPLLTNLQNHEYKDLLILSDSCRIRNPYTGHLISEGAVAGADGIFKCMLDQENDGVDEFFFHDFLGTGPIKIYNIEVATPIEELDGSVYATSLSLPQNHPNPFNASTTISCSLPEEGKVSISIYNLLGQRVATIFEGAQEAGEHTITWDARDFPSGVYFARLEAGGHSENVKMVLLK